MKPNARPRRPQFSSGPCAKRPGWTPAVLNDARTRTFAPVGGTARPSSNRSSTGRGRSCGYRDAYRIGIVPASDTGAVEMALWSLLGSRGVDVLAWEELRTRVGQGHRRPAASGGRPRARGRLRRSCPISAKSIAIATSFSCGTARPRGSSSPHDRWIAPDRKGLTVCDATSRGVRDALALEKARCRYLFLAEGPGRRGRARHAGSRSARRGAARVPRSSLAASQDLPVDCGRQTQRRDFRWRNDQHAFDVVCRGRARFPGVGGVRRRFRRPRGTDPGQRRGDRRLGRCDPLGGLPRRGARDPFVDIRVPRVRRAPGLRSCRRTSRPPCPDGSRRCLRTRTSPSTSRDIAKRLPD